MCDAHSPGQVVKAAKLGTEQHMHLLSPSSTTSPTHQARDLDAIMETYKAWAVQCFARDAWTTVLDNCDRLGHRIPVQVCVNHQTYISCLSIEQHLSFSLSCSRSVWMSGGGEGVAAAPAHAAAGGISTTHARTPRQTTMIRRPLLQQLEKRLFERSWGCQSQKMRCHS